jgi:hypothetical protein
MVSQVMLSKIYVNSFGLDNVISRSFNHIEPCQNSNFIISSFVKRIGERKGELDKSIRMF